MSAPSILQYTPAAFLSGGGPPSGSGITIPVVSAGNGIVVCIQGDSVTVDHMATDVFTDTGEHFTLAPGSQSGACSEIWYLPASAGGVVKIYWTGGPTVTATIGVYELVGGITLETAGHVDWGGISPNAYSLNHTNIPGPSLTTTRDTLIILTGIGCPSFGGSGQSVAAPYTTDFPPTNSWGIQAHLLAVAGTYGSSWAREFNLDYWAVSAAAFYSTPPPTGTITIHKVTDPVGSTQAFLFSTSWGESFTLHDGESYVSIPLVAGHYVVTEAPVVNWSQRTSPDARTLEVIPGTNLDVVFTNITPADRGTGCDLSRTRNAFLLIEKSPQSNQTYQMKAVNYDDNYYAHDGDFDLTGTGGFVQGGDGDSTTIGFGTSFGIFGG